MYKKYLIQYIHNVILLHDCCVKKSHIACVLKTSKLYIILIIVYACQLLKNYKQKYL